MRLPHGMVKKIADKIGISNVSICSIIAKRDNCSPNRAIELENVCKELGYNVPKELWIFGTSLQIKQALLSSKLNK